MVDVASGVKSPEQVPTVIDEANIEATSGVTYKKNIINDILRKNHKIDKKGTQ